MPNEEACYLDERCATDARDFDPHGGVGCGAGGVALCRWCGGSGHWRDIDCPATTVSVQIRVVGTVEGFNQLAFRQTLAGYLGVPVEYVQLSVVSGSILVTASISVPSNTGATTSTPNVEAVERVQERLTSLDATTATAVLQVPILSMAPPTTISAAESVNEATREAVARAKEEAAAPTWVADRPMVVAVIMVASVGTGWAIVLFVLLRRHCRRPATAAKVGGPIKV